jgi:alpha-galactosidase
MNKQMKKLGAVILALGALGSLTAGAAEPASESPANKAKKPLKIYIMVGQSNMQGQSYVGTIPRMALSPESKALHDKLVDENGVPRIHNNVSIAAFSQDGGYGVAPTDQEKHGPLTVGFGNNLKSNVILGPELGFGITMGELVGEPILIIKTAWGGKSLNGDFRPPSAGIRLPEGKEAEALKEKGKYDEAVAKTKEKTGAYYRLMMKHVKTVLADPGKYCTAYDPQQGYELAGFAWFQGYNDRFAGPPYDFYTELLAHFIRDVRKELNAPKMPFAIGVIGINGNNEKVEKELALRKAMAAPAGMPEFKGNVIAVNTADFWDDEMVAATARVMEAKRISDATFRWQADGTIDNSHILSPGWQPVGTPAPQERKWRFISLQREHADLYRPLQEGEKGDERVFLGWTPEELKDWPQPGFDDSTWKEGLAPIGKGDSKSFVKNRSTWGDGNVLLMRTSFDFDPADYVEYRLSVMTSGSYNAYLNGHQVDSFVWWQKGLGYRVAHLAAEQARHLKKGRNVLALYTNINISKGREFSNSVDVLLEALTKEGKANLTTVCGEICTPRDRELAKGKSNQSFHYNGSAYTYSRIGEALAKALAKTNKSGN